MNYVHQTGKASQVAKEMRGLKLAILGVTKTRWTGEWRGLERQHYIPVWQVLIHHMRKVCINLVKGSQKELEGVGANL